MEAAAFFEAPVSASHVRLLAGGPGICALSQIVDGSGGGASRITWE